MKVSRKHVSATNRGVEIKRVPVHCTLPSVLLNLFDLTMKFLQALYLTLSLLLASVSGFGVRSSTRLGGASGGSAFVVSQRPPQSNRELVARTHATARSNLQMGNVAKFGIFSPAVYAAKIVLGQEKLNKIRGKAISLHSQAIGDFFRMGGCLSFTNQAHQESQAKW